MERQKKSFLERLGYLFYVASPNRTSFATPEEVPNYVIEVVPFFLGLLGLEICISSFRKRKNLSFNDGIGSITQGMLLELLKIFSRTLQFAAYVYVYNNWRLTTLPWDSAWTWFLCFLGTDLAYYWLHRASHEINILWAAHQVHHSSEYYNLTTALRQSVMQNLSVWMFYLPMAFAIPPSVFLVHSQLNQLYQFWIHTELINKTGPLEYILNTPSHHRVHHGRNRYCIDKNYAGVLIIWDRMFGTFEPENEEVVYGLTHPINTFSPFRIQLCHYMHMWKTFWSTEGFKNKLSVIFKGPGWEPGKPWHGYIEDIPDVHAPIERYDPKIPSWCTAYAVLHFVLVILGYIEITERFRSFTTIAVLVGISYQVLSFTAIAAILDGRAYAPYLELLRCILFLTIDFYFLPESRLTSLSSSTMFVCQTLLRIYFIFSAFLWLIYCVKATTIRLSTKKIE